MQRFFFFFQAEDGIRDHCVTGVQTCALPISSLLGITAAGCANEEMRALALEDERAAERSEERRVGKECRTRRPQRQTKTKKNNYYAVENKIGGMQRF